MESKQDNTKSKESCFKVRLSDIGCSYSCQHGSRICEDLKETRQNGGAENHMLSPPTRTDALIQTHMHRLHSVTATQFCVHPKTPVASLSKSLSLEDRPTFPRLRTSIVECALPWDWSTGPQGFLVTLFSQFLHRERHSRWPDGDPMLS